MIDKRRVLVYQEHLIRPKRWRPRTSVFEGKWKKGAFLIIRLSAAIQEGNKEWSSLSLHTSNVHIVEAIK